MKIFIISLTFFLMSSFTSNATTSNGEKKICSGFAKWTKEGEFKTIRSKCITEKEYQVLTLSYGLHSDKHSAKEIASLLKIEGSSSYVRVSQLKKQAVDKLIEHVDHSQVLDYL